MIKSFDEMRKIDVLPYCEERDGMKYLNWAKCIELLHAAGVETVWFEQIQNPKDGSSLYYSDLVFTDDKERKNRCYETRILVRIEDKEFIMQSPVMNGVNPVKDNSMSQLRVWNSACRSFVKCIATRIGLGFDLWLKEEMDPSRFTGPATETQKKIIKNLAEKHNVPLDLLCDSNGVIWDELTGVQAGQILNAFKKKYGDA